MPSRVRLEPQLQCPYFSICSLEDALGAARLLQLEGGPPKRPSDASDIASLINIGIDLSSISRYQSLSSAEQHFYPSSLAFDMTCLFERGFVYASNLGLQRKVLLELQSTGKEGLVEPQHLYKLCVISGLISDPTLDVDNVTPDGQRSLLLTVALENHLVSLLTGCIMHWKDGMSFNFTLCLFIQNKTISNAPFLDILGKYASSGCTLKSILVWSWDRVSSIKQLIDKVTQPLFDLSCIELNESTKKALMQNLQQLKHLTRVLEMLMRQGYYGAHTEQGMDELETKYEVTSLINQVNMIEKGNRRPFLKRSFLFSVPRSHSLVFQCWPSARGSF